VVHDAGAAVRRRIRSRRSALARGRAATRPLEAAAAAVPGLSLRRRPRDGPRKRSRRHRRQAAAAHRLLL